jgi:hypothetical protein
MVLPGSMSGAQTNLTVFSILMKKKITYYSLIYLALALAFAIYFASNWTTYGRYKGDEFFYSVYFMLALTYVFYIVLFLALLEKKLFLLVLILVSPLVIAIVSFFLGLILMALFFRGTPVQIIYIYSITYSYLAVGAIVYWLYLNGELLS